MLILPDAIVHLLKPFSIVIHGRTIVMATRFCSRLAVVLSDSDEFSGLSRARATTLLL